MQIDWFTVIAQIVNFVILILLLKYFLYDKIMDALKKREEKISSQLKNAKNKNEEAEEKRQKYEKLRDELEDEKEEAFEEAKKKADEQKKEMVNEARKKVEDKRKEWEKELESQKNEIIEEVRKLISREALAITKKALKEIADENLEDKIILKFSEKIYGLSTDQKEKFKDSLKEAGKQIKIISSFELSKSFKDKLNEMIGENFYKTAEIQYSIDEKIISGIELKIENRKLSWNFNDYLNELDQKFEEILENNLSMVEEDKSEKEDSEK